MSFACILRYKVIPRLFTSHPHSYNNDLQTTLWVKMVYSFQTFRQSTPSSVKVFTEQQLTSAEVNYCSVNTISLMKALIIETNKPFCVTHSVVCKSLSYRDKRCFDRIWSFLSVFKSLYLKKTSKYPHFEVAEKTSLTKNNILRKLWRKFAHSPNLSIRSN